MVEITSAFRKELKRREKFTTLCQERCLTTAKSLIVLGLNRRSLHIIGSRLSHQEGFAVILLKIFTFFFKNQSNLSSSTIKIYSVPLQTTPQFHHQSHSFGLRLIHLQPEPCLIWRKPYPNHSFLFHCCLQYFHCLKEAHE